MKPLTIMKIFVTAKPAAKEERVEKIDDAHFVVAIKEPPVQGRANAAIVCALAQYFQVAPSRVRIVSGYISRQKVLVIE